MDSYIESLRETDPLREHTLRAVIEALQLPLGSRGLDAGCGGGSQAIMLAEAVGPEGGVAGLDLSPELIHYAEEVVGKVGMSEQISLHIGDVGDLPFESDTFDWAWSSDCVGYAPVDPLPLIGEMIRVVKPGGLIAILAWSSEQLLPGYPLLEARLRTTIPGVAPFARGRKPESHFLRGLGWLRELGLLDTAARTYAGGVCAPLDDEMRTALTSLIQMRWPGVESELSEDDLSEFERLCRPESPDYIVDHPDYYAFFTYSLFRGRVDE